MEFPDLGKHCKVSTCDTLDFLPFRCHSCDGHFCLKHRLQFNHSCEKYDNKTSTLTTPSNTPVNKNTCSIRNCKESKMVLVDCNTCKKLHCLSHRNEMDHRCKGKKNESEVIRIDFVQVVCKGQENQFLPLNESLKNDYQSLYRRINLLFKLENNFVLKYVDDENDYVTIVNDNDLRNAWSEIKGNSGKHLTVKERRMNQR
eukprot:TRINITY_DN3727_c0_g1_i2.p1 TRINITY_DN3727_c0_g1~~TRINITY_DN3727_c0_g1_i2.p1  ORF type:complete len:201 (-),score=28.35 TRINITY_DN3727_c0_g1_i2:265-867(-)